MQRSGYRRPMRVTEEAVERNIHQQRELDVQKRQLEAFSKENANLVSVANAQTKIEGQRRLMHQQACKQEQDYQERIRKHQYDKKLRDLTITQNQALAAELDKEEAGIERKKREIQKICEDAPELRELEAMLRIAYLNKERASQHEEKIMLATKEQERIQAIEDQMENDRLKGLRAESERDREKKKMFEKQRYVIQRQIEEKQQQLEEARLQTEKDRMMVDAIINKIREEDETDYKTRKEKQLATAKMVREFEAQRKREKDAAAAAAKAEEDRIMAYNRAMEARNEGVAAKKQAKRDEEDRILQQIVEETEKKRREEEEFNQLRDLLWEEELEAKRNKEVNDRQNYQSQMRRDMMVANEQMLRSKEMLRQQEAENEARLVQLMKEKFAMDEAKERAEEEKRRKAKMEHMSLIERQKLEKQGMYERELEQEARRREAEAQKEEYRKQVIREARKRLLEQHAQQLAGYMPTKVFENQEELQQYQQYSNY